MAEDEAGLLRAETPPPLEPGEPPWIDAFAIHDFAPRLQPARRDRAWMDAFDDRFPYRCLPLTMANGTGWEILCPAPLELSWTGGPRNSDISVKVLADWPPAGSIGGGHFTKGIMTFHTGYLFRTPPGWGVWCGGAPNWPKDGIYPLQGLIETDWLPFPFTMNWIFTRPGTVRFEKDEPFCFITLSEHGRIAESRPRRRRITDDPALEADYRAWSQSRAEFNKALRAREEAAVKSGWQRHYMQGVTPDGARVEGHVSKRRMRPFEES